MSDVTRRLAQATVLLFLVVALFLYVLEEPSWRSLAMASLLIVLFVPIKGLVYRRLGGRRPYFSALVANAASLVAGLPFHFDISLLPHIGVSFLAASAIETFALVGFGTMPTFRRSLLLAVYGSLVVHLISAGFFLSFRSIARGAPYLVLAFVLVHLPTLLPQGWVTGEE